MKEREAVGNVLTDTTGDEGSPSQNHYRVQELCCLVTKVSCSIGTNAHKDTYRSIICLLTL